MENLEKKNNENTPINNDMKTLMYMYRNLYIYFLNM